MQIISRVCKVCRGVCWEGLVESRTGEEGQQERAPVRLGGGRGAVLPPAASSGLNSYPPGRQVPEYGEGKQHPGARLPEVTAHCRPQGSKAVRGASGRISL